MTVFSCCTCAAQYDCAEDPPVSCAICTDERQYVGAEGQRWITRQQMVEEGFRNTVRQVEPGVWALSVEPKCGIGQQAFVIQTPQGNVLWDCLGFLHPECVVRVKELGGVSAIAISHPHFYTACADWAEAFDCQVHLHAADSEWVTRPTPHIQHWSGEGRELWQGLKLMRLGGHFPGSSVLLWQQAGDGQGVVFAGDTVFPVPDRCHVSFMYSFPNLVPLPAVQVARISSTLLQYSFDRIYGPFPQSVIGSGARQAVQASAEQYCGILEGRVERKYL